MSLDLIGFGTYKIVGEDVLPVLDSALENGYRVFDTAKILLPKHNLKREDIYLISKLHPISKDTFNETIRTVDESLDLLKTSFIDLYLIHYPKPNECENEDQNNVEYRRLTYLALEKCVEMQKIRSIGVSNYEVKHLEELKNYATILPSVNQFELHPHFTRISLREYCTAHQIAIQAFSSLARHDEKLFEDENVKRLAEKYGVPRTSIILSWATSQNIHIIPKSTNPERQFENRKLVQLSASEIDRLNGLNIDKNYVGRTTGWLVR